MGAFTILDVLLKLEKAPIEVDAARCVSVRNRNVSCGRCAAVCAGGAIFLDGNEMDVDALRCVGCGTCASVCPTEVFSVVDPDDEQLIEACLISKETNRGTVVITCSELMGNVASMVRPGACVELVCLGRVEEDLAMSLVTRGVREIILVADRCDRCELASGVEQAKECIRTCNVLLEAGGSDVRMELRNRFPAIVKKSEEDSYDELRRGFFSQVRSSAHEVASSVVEQIKDGVSVDATSSRPVIDESGILPRFTMARHDRLCVSCDDLPSHSDARIETRRWGRIAIDTDTCRSCRHCATFCPTGALTRFDQGEDGGFGLRHISRTCVQCGSCEGACITKALKIHPDVSLGDVEECRVHDIPMTRPQPKATFSAIRRGYASQSPHEVRAR